MDTIAHSPETSYMAMKYGLTISYRIVQSGVTTTWRTCGSDCGKKYRKSWYSICVTWIRYAQPSLRSMGSSLELW